MRPKRPKWCRRGHRNALALAVPLNSRRQGETAMLAAAPRTPRTAGAVAKLRWNACNKMRAMYSVLQISFYETARDLSENEGNSRNYLERNVLISVKNLKR